LLLLDINCVRLIAATHAMHARRTQVTHHCPMTGMAVLC